MGCTRRRKWKPLPNWRPATVTQAITHCTDFPLFSFSWIRNQSKFRRSCSQKRWTDCETDGCKHHKWYIVADVMVHLPDWRLPSLNCWEAWLQRAHSCMPLWNLFSIQGGFLSHHAPLPSVVGNQWPQSVGRHKPRSSCLFEIFRRASPVSELLVGKTEAIISTATQFDHTCAHFCFSCSLKISVYERALLSQPNFRVSDSVPRESYRW